MNNALALLTFLFEYLLRVEKIDFMRVYRTQTSFTTGRLHVTHSLLNQSVAEGLEKEMKGNVLIVFKSRGKQRKLKRVSWQSWQELLLDFVISGLNLGAHNFTYAFKECYAIVNEDDYNGNDQYLELMNMSKVAENSWTKFD